MTTTSNKTSSLKKKASVVVTLLMMTTMIAGILFIAPSLSMAQQQQQQQQQTTTGTGTATPTTTPLTPEEQLEQDRMQRTTTAITQNLEQGQKQINGIVYTPRWSEPVWVQPDSLSLLFVYCLPGEYAGSGQEILGGSELEVLESYSLAVTADLTGWLMVVENEHEAVRLPAAVGVICTSDADDPETRVLSQQEQIEINKIIQQFITIRNTVINNVTQIINIINNVTRNGTGGGGVIPTPECPQGTVFNSTTQECELADGQNACREPGFELVNGVCQKPADLSCSEGELVGRDCRYLEESLIPVCPAGSTEQATGFCTDDITGEVVEPTCEGSEYVLEGGNNLRTARCNLYVTVLAEASCSVGVLDEDRAICQILPEPLRVQPELDPLDGSTAPASYLFEARTFGGTEPYTFHWDFGDGQEANVQNTRHTYENPGTYIVTVTVTDSTGQTASGSLSPLTVTPPPTNDTGGGGVTPEPLTARLHLDSTDIPFTHRFEANGNGGTPPYTYHWDFGDGQEANVQNTRHTYENPGTYTATLTVTDSTGQTASESTQVIVEPEAPPPTAEPTTANATGGQ